jgi:hypothetical protein
MKEYAFVVKIVSKAQWLVQAETLEEAEERFNALHEAGEPPVEEDVEDSEIVSVLEEGVPVPPPSKKRYHVEVETASGKKHYEVIASHEVEASMLAGQGRFLGQNADQDFRTLSVKEASAGEAGAVEKAWQFHLDVVGYGEDPEEAWGNLLLYSMKEPPPCERVPDQDVGLENKNEKAATG